MWGETRGQYSPLNVTETKLYLFLPGQISLQVYEVISVMSEQTESVFS